MTQPGELRARREAELRQGRGDVAFDRPLTDSELAGDRAIRFSARNELRDVAFASRQTAKRRFRDALRCRPRFRGDERVQALRETRPQIAHRGSSPPNRRQSPARYQTRDVPRGGVAAAGTRARAPLRPSSSIGCALCSDCLAPRAFERALGVLDSGRAPTSASARSSESRGTPSTPSGFAARSDASRASTISERQLRFALSQGELRTREPELTLAKRESSTIGAARACRAAPAADRRAARSRTSTRSGQVRRASARHGKWRGRPSNPDV